MTLAFFALNGALFFTTLYLQGVRGLGALETGFRFIPIAIGVMIASPLSAKLTVRYGARLVTALGLLLVAVGLGVLSTLGVDSGDLQISEVMVIIAAGLGLAMTPATDAIMGALPKEKFGVGSAVNDTTREIGGALGVAILGSLFSASYAGQMADVVKALPASAASIVSDSLAGAAAVAAQVGGPQGAAIMAAARSSFVNAMSQTSLIGIGFALAGVVVALVFLPDRASASVAVPSAAETERTVVSIVSPEGEAAEADSEAAA